MTHAVTLRWKASTTPGVSYRVYRALGTFGFRRIAAGIVLTTYRDATVQPSKRYSYYVTAFKGLRESVHSNIFTVVVP